MDDVVREFLVESAEGLDQLDRDLVALERRPGDRELLARIFRCVHTIKGTCGFLGFSKLEFVSHVGESLLSLLRDGARELTPERTSALLELVDAVREILTSLETNNDEGDVDYSALIATLTQLQEDHAGVAPPAPSPAVPTADAPRNMGDELIARGLVTQEDVREAVECQRAGDPRRIGEILVDHARVPPAAIVEALAHQGIDALKLAVPGVADRSIRVEVEMLDKLMNLVGELVLVRSQILRLVGDAHNASLRATSQHLNLITAEMQASVLKIRMQPIGSIWSKFPRIVRDLALGFRKQVRIDMEGKETELDKTIIEAIKDPLTHMVRNSVDHGIETPEVRMARGKPAEGRLFMRAFHDDGHVIIEVSDDGGGIDPTKLRANAVRKGVLTVEQASRMDDQEILNLIFAAGFSTAEKVTNVSGRGVGMDVVKTNIENLGGRVVVTSITGRGTTLRITIPLRLAIIPGSTLTAGGERFALPPVSLPDLVRFEGS